MYVGTKFPCIYFRTSPCWVHFALKSMSQSLILFICHYNYTLFGRAKTTGQMNRARAEPWGHVPDGPSGYKDPGPMIGCTAYNLVWVGPGWAPCAVLINNLMILILITLPSKNKGDKRMKVSNASESMPLSLSLSLSLSVCVCFVSDVSRLRSLSLSVCVCFVSDVSHLRTGGKTRIDPWCSMFDHLVIFPA